MQNRVQQPTPAQEEGRPGLAARLRPARLACAMVACATLQGLAPAHAEESRAETARKACLRGDLDLGVRLLSDLFVETKAPDHIYNIGRCYEQNMRYAEAKAKFEEYLTVFKGASEEERTQAKEHIAACDDHLAAKQAASSSAVTPQPSARDHAPLGASPVAARPAGLPENPAPPAPLIRPELTSNPEPTPPPPPPFYRTWWFYTGAGAIVAAGAVTTAILLSRGSTDSCDTGLACRGVK
jgi:hypothetical protein